MLFPKHGRINRSPSGSLVAEPSELTSPIGMMATVEVCAAIPNFLAQEWHWIDSLDLWRNWVKEGEIIQKSFITPPDRPGLGVEMNDEAARKAQVPGTPWFGPTAPPRRR
jgi:galactonate dehydratase